VKGMIRTEKGSAMMVANKYLFWADKSSNKIEINVQSGGIYFNSASCSASWPAVKATDLLSFIPFSS